MKCHKDFINLSLDIISNLCYFEIKGGIMIKVRSQILSTSQARHLEHLGFIVKFITYTINGMLWDIYVK